MDSTRKPQISRAARIALTFVFGLLISLQASAQTLAKDVEKRDKSEDKTLLVLSPFLVEGRTDVGYSSQKSVIGSRSVKELIDLPSAIIVINRELIDDLAALPFSAKNCPTFTSLPVDAGDLGSVVGRPCLMIICSGTQG